MHAPENVVWQAFRLVNLPKLRALYFNVHCGSVPGLTARTDERENRARTAMWAKRIDVVAETDDETWLIEVKAGVRPSAIGQILTYVPLITARNASWAQPRPIVIGGTFDPDARALCGTLGVECYEPPFHVLQPKAPPQ